MLLEEVKIMDAGAKGKAITRLDNGLVLFVEGAVPGDVCDVLVHKKRRSFLEGKPIKFHSYSEKEDQQNASILAYVAVANGSLWTMPINWSINKKR